MAIYAYADETVFTIDKLRNESALGCGIIISETKLDINIIEQALANLKNDPDFLCKWDQRTIDQKYFHASEDSKNAHSHLCMSITHNVKCIFDFSYFDNIKEKDIVQHNFREKMLSRCLSSSTLEFFNSANEVFLTIEKREGLNDSNVANWRKRIYEMYDGATYDIPSFKTYYPKINITLKGKSDPGLQVVDFLIWATARSKMKPPDERWQNRLKFKTWYYYNDKGHNRSQCYLNTAPTYDSKKEKYPFRFEVPGDWPLIETYILIERFLVSIDKPDFSDQSIHLYEDVNMISSRLKDAAYQISSKDLELMGRMFLRLFDTIPLYKDIGTEDKEKWRIMFYAKYLASMLVRNEQIHFIRTKDAILRWRFIAKTENENAFKDFMFSK